MTTGKLPPKPDPATGLPRPPAAPLDNSWGRGHRGPTDRTKAPPNPPPGRGPALEWTSRTWRDFFGGLALVLVIAFGFLALRNGSVDWITDWKFLLVIVIISVLGVLVAVWISGGQAAGNDWVRDGKKWVKTYELAEVKLGEPRAKDTLILEDADGRKFSIGLMMIQSNPSLWDLVYNGMLHSVYYNGATINERAREKLRLDPQLHLIYDDEL